LVIIINGTMDLNHIVLSGAMVADLYSASLIDDGKISSVPDTIIPATTTPQPKAERPTTEWKSLGNNQKNILVLTSSTDAVHLPDDELTFFTGILTACHLTLADVAIVNLNSNSGASYKELTSYFKSKHAFLFGIEPASMDLPISFPHFQVQVFAGTSYLFSPSFKELENDKVLKSKLWVCLKKIFNL
jgi:hypothetical protein